VVQVEHTDALQKLRHVVMFGWKPGTDAAELNKVVEAFCLLPGKISLIKGFEWGTNNSPEGLNQGLSHCFCLTFTSEQDRDAYLVHPAHKIFVDMPKQGLNKVTVLDYWVKE
jgi:Stress responsive A/B Barrel Domain